VDAASRSAGRVMGADLHVVDDDQAAIDALIRQRQSLERGDHVELAAVVLHELGPAPLTFDEGSIYRYADPRGVWDRVEPAVVQNLTANLAGSDVRTKDGFEPLRVSASTTEGVCKLVRVRLETRDDRVRFERARTGIAFANGFVIVESGVVRLLPHAAEHMARYAFPFAFDERAETTRLQNFFDEVFQDASEDERAARVQLLQEFVGACLIGDAPKYQRCLLLVGLGGEGKGETIKILRSAFPPDSMSALPPHTWGRPFQLVGLIGKLANFVDETPPSAIEDAEIFKKVITGDPTYTDVKNRDGTTFTPRAGHIFLANTLPGTEDLSDGFFRRFIIVNFTRQMYASSAHQVDAAVDIIAHERPAIVAWALAGAARLQRQGRYTISDEMDRAVVRWRMDCDPVRAFVAERIEADGETKVRARDLFRDFREWARDNGFHDMSIAKFGRRVRATRLYTHEHHRDGDWYVPVVSQGGRQS
jgi:P4 family phage/plasmid primase-like protien